MYMLIYPCYLHILLRVPQFQHVEPSRGSSILPEDEPETSEISRIKQPPAECRATS